ncbi:collagen-like protein [Enterococcus gallinarum]|nr:collagen-like protein [Enterococcus gallinarum]
MARCVSATGTSALPGDYQVVNIGTGWTVVSLIVNSFPTDVQTLRFIPYSIIDPIPDLSQFFLDLSRWKIEFGDGTVYTPSPEDDFINAYPSYVGSYTTFDDVQSTNPADYTWQRILGMNGENGKDGIAGKDGVGVSDTNITYAQSTSGTSAPTSGWTIQVPALIKGQYLWTKTTWTYTDSSTETGYTVSYNAKDGNNGTDGIAGKDGVGISSTKIEYVSSTSGTVKPTTGWTTSIPTVPAGSFLWTKTTWTYTDGTNESGYSAAKMGEKGDQGIQGPKGSDGQTYYTWLKYADTPTSGMSDSPTGKAYIGLAYNKPTATESTNYADYTWSLIRGSDGAQGPKGDNGQTLYTWIKYATSATGAGMSDSPTGKTYIGLAYNKTTATESTNAADYTWSLIKGDKGDTGATGPQGPQGPTGPKGDRGLMGIAYVQQTQPSDKTEGVQWFKTDSTDKKIIASYVYKSGAWQEKKYASATLAVESLDALSASLGKITSGEINGVIINGSQFISPFDKEKIVGGSNWVKGTLTNADGMSVLEWTEYVKASGQTAATGKNIFYYDGVSTSRTRGSRTQTSYFGVDGIQLIDTNYSSIPAATLTIEDLFKIGATELSPASGFSIYSTGSTNLPTARRNGRIVQLAGAFKNNNAITVNAEQITIGYVPEWARPDQATNTVVQGSGMNRFMLVVNPGGAITISRYGTTSYTQAVAGSWLNIACVYSAKDM